MRRVWMIVKSTRNAQGRWGEWLPVDWSWSKSKASAKLENLHIRFGYVNPSERYLVVPYVPEVKRGK